jgi:release factor glutamine methyltransferase
MMDAHTVADSLRMATGTLAAHSDSPRLDAELLLGKILGLNRSGLTVHGALPLSAARCDEFASLIAQRARGVPVAYLIGRREFWSLELTVTPDVLVPRPETELLVELALQRVAGTASVLDLGTGSGAIALAIASERPGARVTGVDVSAAALSVAMNNSRGLDLSAIEWRLGSWFDAVPGERFDVIVANPPYVADNDDALASLAAEPTLALVSGPTGLESLHVIVDRAPAHLHPGGWLLLEHGSAQADEVGRMLRRQGFDEVRTHRDLSGRPRVTLGTVSPSH